MLEAEWVIAKIDVPSTDDDAIGRARQRDACEQPDYLDEDYL